MIAIQNSMIVVLIICFSAYDFISILNLKGVQNQEELMFFGFGSIKLVVIVVVGLHFALFYHEQYVRTFTSNKARAKNK